MAAAYMLAKTPKGSFRFNLRAGNNQTILTSQLYAAKKSALNGIESVRVNGVDDERFERKVAKDGSPYFVLKARNGQVVGTSEMYKSVNSMENGIASVKKNADAPTIDEA